jgi:outer membrane protein assembly factor BamB
MIRHKIKIKIKIQMNPYLSGVIFSLMLFGCLDVCLSSSLLGETWPQWRGPDRNGMVAESSVLDSKPQVLWKAEVGDGLSSFVIAEGTAFTLGSSKAEETVYALDIQDGSQLWSWSYPCEGEQYYTGATPAWSSGRLYVVGKKGRVICLESKTGKVFWERDLVEEAKCTLPDWGFTGSPLVDSGSGRVFLNAGSSGFCLDAETGQTIWGTQDAYIKGGYASPVLWEMSDQPQRWILLFSSNCLQAVDQSTGAVQFRYPWVTTFDVNAADPGFLDDEVFISSGHGAGAAALKIAPAKAKNDFPFDYQIRWKSQVMRNFFSASILKDGLIYGIDGNNDAALKCVDWKTGEAFWSWDGKRVGGVGLGTFIFVGNQILLITEKGNLVVGHASKEGFTLESSTQILGGKCWTAPALANGMLITRNSRGQTIGVRVSSQNN